MMPSPMLQLYGGSGRWDEILCLVPSVLLVCLTQYGLCIDKKQSARAEARSDSGATKVESSRRTHDRPHRTRPSLRSILFDLMAG